MVKTLHTYLKEMKSYAIENKIPIMQDEGIDYLTTFLVSHQIKSVLEIGTAIGYSAIMMAIAMPNMKITSIERDEKRYLEAVKNIKKFKLENRITLLYRDALETNITDNFDLIFIDAAKGQNINFFKRFERNLNEHGFIITDNMYFHGYVKKDPKEIKSKNLKGLVKKIKDYHKFLSKNGKYKTKIYDVGDGIAVSEKIK